jgi:uncharacterized membrane protein
MLVAVFDSESQAYQGSRILRELDADGSIETVAVAVLAKDGQGKVVVKEETGSGAAGTATGLLAGTLVGLLAGPVGVALAAGAGTIGGAMYDLTRIGVGSDFLDEVGRELQAGKYAVVAEVWEEWVMPVDARIEAEAASLRAELAQAAAAHKARLSAKIDGVKAKLRANQQRAEAALASLQAQTEGTLAKLQAKAAKAHGENKAKLEARAAEIRADLARRGEKLRQAWQLTKQALEA